MKKPELKKRRTKASKAPEQLDVSKLKSPRDGGFGAWLVTQRGTLPETFELDF